MPYKVNNALLPREYQQPNYKAIRLAIERGDPIRGVSKLDDNGKYVSPMDDNYQAVETRFLFHGVPLAEQAFHEPPALDEKGIPK